MRYLSDAVCLLKPKYGVFKVHLFTRLWIMYGVVSNRDDVIVGFIVSVRIPFLLRSLGCLAVVIMGRSTRSDRSEIAQREKPTKPVQRPRPAGFSWMENLYRDANALRERVRFHQEEAS